MPISSTLTEVPALANMPVPEIPYGMAGCYRPGGCLSNRQFDQALSTALDWGSRSADNLRAIRKAGESAVNPQEPTK